MVAGTAAAEAMVAAARSGASKREEERCGAKREANGSD
jgi:hypothetical protein